VIVDAEGMQGQLAEQTTWDGSQLISVDAHSYTDTQTARRDAPDTPGVSEYAFMVTDTSDHTATWLPTSSTWRWTEPGKGKSGPRTASVNKAGNPYPRVTNPLTGEPVTDPSDGAPRVPKDQRADWGKAQRGQYIKQWYDNGNETPGGGWSGYEIHHILPREFGGTNDFDNLVPLVPGEHLQFTLWWAGF
jgi:hypothetical protein